MTSTPTGYLRAKTRAANLPSPKRTAEERLADKVIDAQVRKDADRGRAWLATNSTNKDAA